MAFTNPVILARFDQLIADAEEQLAEMKLKVRDGKYVLDPVRLTEWATSSLNLLDKLSASTNRFVREFEEYGRVSGEHINLGLALGVLRSARKEYEQGLAVDYQLSVSATVFSGLLDEARYLMEKDYTRAAAVLAGAALEESLRSHAKVHGVALDGRETLFPLIQKVKSVNTGITDFDARRMQACGDIRNAAAHGGQFHYSKQDVQDMISQVQQAVERLLSQG